MKNNYIELLSDKIVAFTGWVINHRVIVIITCIIMCTIGIFLSQNLRIDNSVEAYFLDDDPSYVQYKNFMEEYGNDEYLYIVYKARSGIFNLQTLEKTRALVSDIEKAPYVKKIHAVTNIEFIEGNDNGDIIIYDFMKDFPSTQKEADLLKRKLLDKPMYINAFISGNAELAAILCEMEDKPGDDPNYFMKIGASLNKILSKPDYSNFEFWPVGEPILNYEFYTILEEDSNTLSALTLILIFILLIAFFRQAKGVAGPLFVVIFALLLVVGFMGLKDYPVTGLFDITPSLLIAIGVATTVHIINEYRIHLKAGYDNRSSILEAMRLVGAPCLFTSLTTAVGFGSMMISSTRVLREYGSYTVFGVMAILFFSFTILLVILSLAGKGTEKKFSSLAQADTKGVDMILRPLDRMLERIALFNKKYYRAVLIIAAIISGIAIYGVTELQVNSSWLEEFGEKQKIFRDYKFVDKAMGGSMNFEVLLNSNKTDGVKSAEFVHALDKIQTFADSQGYIVRKTNSIVDIVKEINRSLHNNDKSYYRLPSLDEEVSQYILLYEVSGGEELEKILSADMATARLTIYVKSVDSQTGKRFYDDLVSMIESVKRDGYSYKISGVSFLTLRGMRYIGETQRYSLLFALLIITGMMIIIFRSVKIGLVSMLPNIFPIILTLGFMGLAGIWLDYVRTLISCIAIGLSVDDTIHLISRYQVEFRRLGNYEKALDVSLKDVGRAVTITTIILIIGFIVTMVSQLNDIYYFGLLSSICIFIALLADYFIAPSLILLIKPFGKETSPAEEKEYTVSCRT